MTRIIMLGILAAMLSSCSNEVVDLKSPCVGAEGSPCDKRPVNDWWVS